MIPAAVSWQSVSFGCLLKTLWGITRAGLRWQRVLHGRLRLTRSPCRKRSWLPSVGRRLGHSPARHWGEANGLPVGGRLVLVAVPVCRAAH